MTIGTASPPRAVWLAAIGLTIALAAGWLSYQSYRYFADPGAVGERAISPGAIDVHNRHDEVHSWFAGEPVYKMYKDAVYPPASYAILAIALRPLPWEPTRFLWFAASLVSAGILARQLVRHSLARSRLERIFIGVMPFGFYATGAALGNGQLVLFVLPMVLAALLRLGRPELSRRDLWLGSLLMLAALVQPTIAAPFFWLVLFRSPSVKPAVLIVAGYVTLTVFALAFQMRALPRAAGNADPVGVMDTWVHRAQGGTYYGSVLGGYGTVHDLMVDFGMQQWNSVASLAILVLAGIWLFRHRRSDLWLVIGVTAIVARVWTYHRWYDDLLLVLPLLSLFRLVRMPDVGRRTRLAATAIFLWIWVFLLPPGVLYTLPAPEIPVAIQVTGWLVGLAFLVGVAEARRDHPATSDQPPGA
jgi:hypothetical protein